MHIESPPLTRASSESARRALSDELQRFLAPCDRRAFIGCSLPIVHHHAPTLQADVAVALDADPRARRIWNTPREGRPVDVVFRFVERDRLTALTEAARHVELGAHEAFVFDRQHGALWGFRREERRVDAVPLSIHGTLRSRVLGLELFARGAKLCIVPAATSELHDVLDRLDRALTRIQREWTARAAS